MTSDELPATSGSVRVTLYRAHGLQRFRLPASALHLRVLSGILRVTSSGTARTFSPGAELDVPSGHSVRLEPRTPQVELDLWCAPPGPEHVLRVLADPSTESSTRMTYAGDGGVELLLDPMPM